MITISLKKPSIFSLFNYKCLPLSKKNISKLVAQNLKMYVYCFWHEIGSNDVNLRFQELSKFYPRTIPALHSESFSLSTGFSRFMRFQLVWFIDNAVTFIQTIPQLKRRKFRLMRKNKIDTILPAKRGRIVMEIK